MDIGEEAVLPVEHNDGAQPSYLNICDVFDAISRADPQFDVGVAAMTPHSMSHMGGPFVRIVEQPAGKALRYECEGRSAGSIPGSNSTPEKKTYPTIEIRGHRGPAIIVVSCVTREEPYKPHPHNLVGRERCENGVCTVKTNITEDNPQVSFSNLGIQCVKRKEIAEALRTREKLRVDPFKTGFSHMNQLQSIDLNAVRLCFQVFIQDERTGKIRKSLPPVVSDVIYDKKAMSDLIIMRVSHCSASPKGGTEIILLCERITREDISVVFFEKDGDQVVWEESANIVLVHRQYAIAFQTPPYRRPDARENVQVYLQLKRISDNARSNALPFEFIAADYQDPVNLRHKRQKTISSVLDRYDQRGYKDEGIKAEPKDKTPPHHMGSPRQVFSPPYEHEPLQTIPYQWELQAASYAGPSHVTYAQDVQWNPNYMAGTLNVPVMSPTLPAMTPNMHAQMTALDRISPMAHGGMSPNLGHVSPAMGHVSPALGHVSPGMGHVSPGMGHVSPGMGHVSPGMGHVSPNVGYISPNMMPQQELMETGVTDSPSLTRLLEPTDMGQLSEEFSGLSGLAAALDRGPDLSDSLNRLSTSELLH